MANDFTPTEEEVTAFNLVQQKGTTLGRYCTSLALRLAGRALAAEHQIDLQDASALAESGYQDDHFKRIRYHEQKCRACLKEWQPADWIKHAAEHPEEWQK